MSDFHVVDLRPNSGQDFIVSAQTPVEAAETKLGMRLTRSGSPKNLVCKVYWNNANGEARKNMVRLYERKTY